MCNGRGTCVKGSCFCQVGWAGSACERPATEADARPVTPPEGTSETEGVAPSAQRDCAVCADEFQRTGGCEALLAGQPLDAFIPAGCFQCGEVSARKCSSPVSPTVGDSTAAGGDTVGTRAADEGSGDAGVTGSVTGDQYSSIGTAQPSCAACAEGFKDAGGCEALLSDDGNPEPYIPAGCEPCLAAAERLCLSQAADEAEGTSEGELADESGRVVETAGVVAVAGTSSATSTEGTALDEECCPNGCSSNGVCVACRCQCGVDWEGSDCSQWRPQT